VTPPSFQHLVPDIGAASLPGEPRSVVVVGAGLSGLVAAQVLASAGQQVTVVDKGRSVGGRLATRRIDESTFDHGAQFFTVRGEDFASIVNPAIADDIVFTWCEGFGPQPDGYPRYAVRGGMNAFAKYLAVGLTTELSCHVDRLTVDNGAWTVETSSGTHRADAVALTAPVPQSLALFERSSLALPPAVSAELAGIEYFATLGLLVRLDQPVDIGTVGGLQLDSGPFTFIADNQRKGVSAAPALTFHAEHDYSAARYDDDPDEVLAELLGLAAPWIEPATVVDSQLKKWLYAGPKQPHAQSTVRCEIDGAPVLFAGDAFAGPKVEGAFNSGLAAARSLLAG